MRRAIHKLICWYLRRCGGTFHCYPYGETGRYVALMTDDQYHVHQKTERVVREILIAHGSYGDGSNLDKLTRSRCLELLKATDSQRVEAFNREHPNTAKTTDPILDSRNSDEPKITK